MRQRPCRQSGALFLRLLTPPPSSFCIFISSLHPPGPTSRWRHAAVARLTRRGCTRPCRLLRRVSRSRGCGSRHPASVTAVGAVLTHASLNRTPRLTPSLFVRAIRRWWGGRYNFPEKFENKRHAQTEGRFCTFGASFCAEMVKNAQNCCACGGLGGLRRNLIGNGSYALHATVAARVPRFCGHLSAPNSRQLPLQGPRWQRRRRRP